MVRSVLAVSLLILCLSCSSETLCPEGTVRSDGKCTLVEGTKDLSFELPAALEVVEADEAGSDAAAVPDAAAEVVDTVSVDEVADAADAAQDKVESGDAMDVADAAGDTILGNDFAAPDAANGAETAAE